MVTAFFIAWSGFQPNIDLRTQEPKHHSAELENLAKINTNAVLTAGGIQPAEQRPPLKICGGRWLQGNCSNVFHPVLGHYHNSFRHLQKGKLLRCAKTFELFMPQRPNRSKSYNHQMLGK